MAAFPGLQKYVNIYTEANPNPNSLKFVFNDFLVEEGHDYDFTTAQDAAEAPLALALLEFEGIERVFIMNNFVTLTKSAEQEWPVIAPPIKSFLKEYIEAGKPVLNQHTERQDAIREDDPEVVKRIKGLLDEYVRPSVESDGGAISFREFSEEGVVTVELRGSCSGCPSSTLTLKAGIENLLTRMVPEVKSVQAVNM